MDQYKFRVQFLEDANEFLAELDEKQEKKYFTTFDKPETRTIMNFFFNLKTKFGNLEQNLIITKYSIHYKFKILCPTF